MKAFSPLPLIGHYGGLTIKGLCLAHLIDPARFIEPKVKNPSSVAMTDQILCMLHIKYVSHNELLRVDWWEFETLPAHRWQLCIFFNKFFFFHFCYFL